MRNGHLIYNPSAGRYQSIRLIQHAARELERNGWRLEVKETLSGEHLTQLASRAAHENVDALFVAGGDGSIEKAISGLIGSQTALGVLPAGTANVWAQEIGLPGRPWMRFRAMEMSARHLANARARSVDVGLCNEVPFLLWAGVGLDAIIVHSVEPRKRWKKYFGMIQYMLSALKSARRWQGVDLTIHTGDQVICGRYLVAVMSNIRHYAGGIAILSPDASLDDGIMELWLFSGDNLGDALRHGWDLWLGNHVHSKQVQRVPFRNLTVESDTDIYVQVDGEPLRAGNFVQIQVKQRALRALIPMRASRQLFEIEKADARG